MSADDLSEAAIEESRRRINAVRRHLAAYFVDKQELVDLMVIATIAQEPLLIVGKPGTAKSDLVVKFTQAIGVPEDQYFEYMLTKFTEPGEVIGPIDINEMKAGRYRRRIEGKLPRARVAFLDEVFKSNSAILNTLLTIINERKFYQDGKPLPVDLVMLFGATNEIPEFSELAALRDRFTLKVESRGVRHKAFGALIDRGLANDGFKADGQRPWAELASLDDFLRLKRALDRSMLARRPDDQDSDRDLFFPEPVFALFRRAIEALEKEERIEISDRKVIKLYKLMRTRAFLLRGGVVDREDLALLRYVPDRLRDFEPVRQKVNRLLDLDR